MAQDQKADISVAGRYNVIEPVSLGAGQIWYRAKDALLPRHVLLRLSTQKRVFFEKDAIQLKHECRILSRLNNPHIIWLIDFGQDSQYGYYMIVEDLAGSTLREHLNQFYKLSPKKCLKIMAQICIAVQEMHEEGIIFNQLNPESILISSDELVKITDVSRSDFYLTSNPNQTTIKETSLAKEQISAHEYLAPELLDGARASVTSDLYSWGVLAYELLTGLMPFGQSDSSSSIRLEMPAPIPGCPDELAALVYRCLLKEPSMRPKTAAGLLQDCMRLWKDLYSEELLFNSAYIDIAAQKKYRDPHLAKDLILGDERLAQSGMINAPHTPRVGTIIAKYRLVKQLGQGGMGVVFLAQHVYLGNKLACKILHADFAKNSEIQQRFINEAKAMASLRHPNIISVFDCDLLPDGSAYILMEFLSGHPLSTYVKNRGPLTERETLTIALQITKALVEAHNHNIIHRDLKPDNIFISETDTNENIHVKVLDFGIAKFDATDGTEKSITQTRPGTIMGTPGYMPPEQIRSSDKVDHRADLYSLGAVLYYMLAGHSPFERGVDQVAEHFVRVLTESVPQIERKINPRLSTIIYRLLEKSPNLRFQTASQLLVAIEGLLSSYADNESQPKGADGESTAQRPDGPSVDAGVSKELGAVFATHIAPIRGAQESDSWGILRSHLPSSWDNHLISIRIFLSRNFSECESIGAHVLRLKGIRMSDVSEYEYFAVFMEGTGTDPANIPELGTRTFRNYTTPLEAYLERLQSDTAKVVIVIADTMELGRGVREKILDYRIKFSAFVVPLYIGELEKAPRLGQLDNLFIDRLTDLHTAPDYFSNNPRTGDPTCIFGLKGLTNDITTLVRNKTALISIFGVPGSGKTTLVKMIEYSLDGSRFLWIRCDALSEENIQNLVIAVTRALSGDLSPEIAVSQAENPDPAPTLLTLRPVLEGIQRLQERLVLVLENADWLLDQLRPLRPEAAELEKTEQVRKFLIHLVGLTQANLLTIIITSVRGFSLASRALHGWPNPIASIVHCFMSPPIEYRAMMRMLQELGIQMNVTFSLDAIRLTYEWSGGNILIIRKLCSHVVKWHRQREEQNVLAAVRISKRDMEQACQDLISARATFGETILPWLSESERIVLYQISAGRPRQLEQLKDTLRGIATSVDVSDALDLLQQTGLVRRVKGRLRVSIPLLEAWVKANIDQSHVEIQRVRARRFRVISAGMAATAFLFLIYWQVFQLSMSYTPMDFYDKCSYAVKFPKRGIENAEIFLFRTCIDGNVPLVPINLLAADGTVAQFGEYFGEARDVFRCPQAQPRCSQSHVEIKLISPWMDGYSFVVMTGKTLIGRFCIQHDHLSRVRKSFDNAWKIISLLPAFLGLLAAFFKEWMEALSRLRATLWGRKASGSAAPEENSESK